MCSFNDQEIVALSGAHAVGRCHADRSGFDGPWQHSPTSFNNEYFNLLLNEKWSWKKWDGPKQFEDKSTGSLMMLPTDVSDEQAFKRKVHGLMILSLRPLADGTRPRRRL